ncbi:MAG TPA: hypothetical protein VFL85_05100 [Candidatus Saccharimonadales bacterium]|nr:hypothetical protein [Candidatus Saccharimonadales bacterium]
MQIVTQIHSPVTEDIKSVMWGYQVGYAAQPGTLVLDEPQRSAESDVIWEGTGVYHHKHGVIFAERTPNGRLRRRRYNRQDCRWWLFRDASGASCLKIGLLGRPTDRFGGRI